MLFSISMSAVALNSILTASIVIGILLLLVIEKILLKKYEDSLRKVVVIVIFILTFFIVIFGVFSILLIWNFDLLTYILDMSYDIGVYIGHSIGKVVSSALVIFFSMLLLKISKMAFRSVGNKPGLMQRRKKTIAKVSVSIIKYMVGILTILVVLAVWGINVAPALAGLGILGLVIGLGAQKFINDLISGFFIVFEHHFDVGDVIEVQGFKGEVTSIGLKTTKILNWKGEEKILANGEISSLINYSKSFSLAVVEFGIAYHEDVQKAIDILNEELPKMRLLFPEIIEDPKVLGISNLGNSSVDMRAIAKTLNQQHYGIERELRKHIKQILDQHGIEIPFPQVVVHHPESKD